MACGAGKQSHHDVAFFGNNDAELRIRSIGGSRDPGSFEDAAIVREHFDWEKRDRRSKDFPAGQDPILLGLNPRQVERDFRVGERQLR